MRFGGIETVKRQPGGAEHEAEVHRPSNERSSSGPDSLLGPRASALWPWWAPRSLGREVLFATCKVTGPEREEAQAILEISVSEQTDNERVPHVGRLDLFKSLKSTVTFRPW